MKKLISILLSIMLLTSVFTGCGKRTESQVNSSENENADVEEIHTNGSEEDKLTVTSYGNNIVLIDFKDECIGELYSETNDCMIDILFMIDDTSVMCLHATDSTWYAYPQAENNFEPEWFYDGENPEIIDENAISWKISRDQIGSLLKQCNQYRVILENENKEELIAEGSLQFAEGDIRQVNDIEMLIIRDDLMDIRVKNQEAVNHESQSGHIYDINFYSSGVDIESQGISVQLTISQYETVWATIYTYESTGERSEEDVLNDEGGIEVGRTIKTDYGMAIQLNNSSLIDMIKKQETYEIADDVDYTYSTGYVADAYIEVNPVIPSEFISGDEYDSWFVPVTDNYKIIEIVQEDNQFGTPCWYQRMGQWVYGSEEPYFNEDVKTVYLLSFDEFGLVDSKMKIMYESETALQSDIYYNLRDYIVAETLTGVNQPDDSLITTEFEETCDKEVFNNYAIDSSTFTYEYIGHSDNIRYLSYFLSFESALHEFFGWGTNDSYSDFKYSSNEIFEGKMDNNDYPFPYRTYYCEPYPNATILNYD